MTQPEHSLFPVVAQHCSFCYLYCFSSSVFLTWVFWPALESTNNQVIKWMYPWKQYRYLKDLLSCMCKYLNVRTYSTSVIHEWQTENSISYRENDIFFPKRKAVQVIQFAFGYCYCSVSVVGLGAYCKNHTRKYKCFLKQILFCRVKSSSHLCPIYEFWKNRCIR